MGRGRHTNRTFIVVCEVYTTYGDPPPIWIKLFRAKDENALALKLDPSIKASIEYCKKEAQDYNEVYDESPPIKILEDSHGDGSNYYIIKEVMFSPKGNLILKRIL